jgi:hypothetical protein
MTDITNTTTTGPAVSLKTLYQCLLSVNSVVDQDKFEASDREATQLRYKNVFMQNTVGDDIFDAIASKSGSKAVMRNEASTYYNLNECIHLCPHH